MIKHAIDGAGEGFNAVLPVPDVRRLLMLNPLAILSGYMQR